MAIQSERKKRRDSLDKLFSEYVRRKSGGYCERCGKWYGWKRLQCCHFHSRRNHTTRWSESNVAACDAGCHLFLDSHPVEKVEFFRNRLGEAEFQRLNVMAQATTKSSPLDMEALRVYYTAKLREMK